MQLLIKQTAHNLMIYNMQVRYMEHLNHSTSNRCQIYIYQISYVFYSSHGFSNNLIHNDNY